MTTPPQHPELLYLHRIWQYIRQRLVRLRKWYEQQSLFGKAMAWSGALLTAVLLGMVSFCTLVYIGVFGPLPDYGALRAIRNYTASTVYASDGVMLGKYYIENRLNADFEELSPDLINALVATEDARFFEHSGIDPRALGRVLLKTILNSDRSAGGGSTLSQQLAKNLFPRKDFGLLTIPVNKVREMILARRLEKIYTKEELLNLYLNTVPFSENIFGVKVAAQRFFNTSPAHLRAEQAAVLVGMLKATTSYNPVLYPERAISRRNTVLHQMMKYGYLKVSQLDSLVQLPLNLSYRPEGSDRGLATYFRAHLRLEVQDRLDGLKKPDGTPYNLYTDGLKIFTTIDSRLQRYAESALRVHIKKLQQQFDKHWTDRILIDKKTLKFAVQHSERFKKLKDRKVSQAFIDSIFNTPVDMTVFDWEAGSREVRLSPLDSIKYHLSLLRAGIFAIDPGSGGVKVWVGGIDHHFFKYDHVNARRQAGSIFKPIVYAAALQQNISPCDYIDNMLTAYGDYDNWTPKNADGEYGGVYSMEGGLANSVNTVTVDLMMRTGIEPVQQLAGKLGITGAIPKVPSIALGTPEVSLREMVQVYGAIANRGRRPEVHYLLRVENADGEVLIEKTPPPPNQFEQVLPEASALQIRKMLETVVDSGTARRLRWEFGLQQDMAGKTGTTQYNADGWYIGFTPEIVAGVWVGGELPQIRFRDLSLGQGSNTALPVWGHFYKNVLTDPAFKNWRNSKFEPLPDSLLIALDCPLYLEERPLPGDGLFDKDGWRGLFRDIISIFKNEENATVETDTVYLEDEKFKNSKGQTLSEESRRIREHNERIEKKRERKKRRKKFWDKVFGRDQ